jgi:hypothetical protein
MGRREKRRFRESQRAIGVSNFAARVQEIVGRAAERAEVSLERVLREFAEVVKVDAVYGISDQPMTAEGWKKQYVKPLSPPSRT